MPLLLAEGIVDSVITYLRENQAAKLQALRAEYDDDVPLPAFEDFPIDHPPAGGPVPAPPRVHLPRPVAASLATPARAHGKCGRESSDGGQDGSLDQLA